MTHGPFATWAHQYLAAGWPVFPLAPGKRGGEVPRGFSGADGVDPSGADLAAWIEDGKGTGNVAIRYPASVVALDEDDPAAFAVIVATVGPLPPTWQIRSRSGGFHHLYRLPPGVDSDRFVAKMMTADGVCAGDILRRMHRFSCAPGSVVAPDGKVPNPLPYAWIDPDGGEPPSPVIPTPEDLAVLPEPWCRFLEQPVHPRVSPLVIGDRWNQPVLDHHDDAGAAFAAHLIAYQLDRTSALFAVEAYAAKQFVGVDPADPFTQRDFERWLRPAAYAKFAFTAPATDPADVPASWTVNERWWDGSGEVAPSVLARADARALLYAGKVNSIIGPSESGKSWLALLAVTQHDGAVTYIDFESDGPSIAGRLAQMGMERERMEAIRYLRPDEPYTGRGAGPATLVVVDGLNTFYGLHGVDYTDTVAVTQFHKKVLEPWADTGACVVLIDHTTKNTAPGQGAGAIGSQAKRATLTGASLKLRMTEAFGRGRLGRAIVKVDKDRPGFVRGMQCEDESVAQLVVDDRGVGTDVHLGLSPWVSQEFAVQAATMGRHDAIRDALAAGPLSQTQLAEAIGRDRSHMSDDLADLEALGHLSRVRGAGRRVLHHWIGPLE